MRRTTCLALVALLLTSLAPLLAQESKPLTLDDVVAMRREKKTHEEIIDQAKERGLAFEVDAKAEGRLRLLRFSKDQIDTLKLINEVRAKPAPGNAPAPGAAPGVAPGDAPNADAPKPDDPLAMKALAEARFGPRMPDNFHASTNQLIKDINEASNANLTMTPLRSITLSAKKTYADRYAKDIAKLEAILARVFPEPIHTGTDKRSAHIVIIETRYEYEAWVRAMFKIYQARGGTIGGGEDPMGMLLRSSSFIMQTHCVLCLEGVPDEEVRRRMVAYFVGHMTMTQLTEGRGPAAMATGFGNWTETELIGSPNTMVFSYSERKIAGSGNRWLNIVRDRIAKNEGVSIPGVMRYTTSDMKEEHYAEAWSFMTVLAKAPDKLAQWITRVRDLQLAKDSLEKAYERDEKALTKAWHSFVTGGK